MKSIINRINMLRWDQYFLISFATLFTQALYSDDGRGQLILFGLSFVCCIISIIWEDRFLTVTRKKND